MPDAQTPLNVKPGETTAQNCVGHKRKDTHCNAAFRCCGAGRMQLKADWKDMHSSVVSDRKVRDNQPRRSSRLT